MYIHYDSVFYNENNNQNNENAYIKDRVPQTIIAYITRLKQHVPNIDIYFTGSVTNFTFFNNCSDIDIAIVYPDEYVKTKLVNFITEYSLQFHIKKIKFEQIKLSHTKYSDEFYEVYNIDFDDGNRIDIAITLNIGPILRLQHNPNIIILLLLYIIKWLHYCKNIISLDTLKYLKNKINSISHYINNNTAFRSEKQIIKNVS